MSGTSALLSIATRGLITTAPSVASSIAVAIVPGSGTVLQDGTVEYSVNVTRVAFPGAVGLAVTGLPTGVTGVFNPTSLGTDETGATLTLSAAVDAPVIADDVFTVTATATGLDDATDTATVSVALATEPASISISAVPTAASVEQGSTRDYTVTLVRTEFTADVTIATTGLPSGVSASYPDGAVFSGATTTRTVRLTATGGAGLVTDDSFTVTATGSGVSDATATPTVSVIEPIAADAFVPSRPAGMITVGDSTFLDDFNNDDVASPTVYSYGDLSFTKYAGTKLTVGADASTPSGTGFAARMKTPAGQTSGAIAYAGPASMSTLRREIHFAFSHNLVSPYRTDGANIKTFYPYVKDTTGGAAFNGFSPGWLGESTTPGARYRWRGLQTLSWDGSTWKQPNLSDNVSPYTGGTYFYMDQGSWYRTEIWARIESTGPEDHAIGVANGAYKIWVSAWSGSAWGTPVLIHDYTGVRVGLKNANTIFWHGGSGVKHFRLYNGGTGGPAPASDQFVHVGRLHFSENT
jgi:hypothetical protein